MYATRLKVKTKEGTKEIGTLSSTEHVTEKLYVVGRYLREKSGVGIRRVSVNPRDIGRKDRRVKVGRCFEAP